MRVLLLCNGGSSHIEKWVLSLAAENIEIGIFSLQHFDPKVYSHSKNISILHNPEKGRSSFLSKLGYLKNLGKLKQQIKAYQPHIVHAHYATSYGLLGVKSRFKPLVISVWGSDVYDFPKKSGLHKQLLKNILSRAESICSTSYCMKEETLHYTAQKIEVVPFGIDTGVFKPGNNDLEKKSEITVGIIKSLEKKYGIEYLIKAFAEVARSYNQKKLNLLIVGDGSKKTEYQKLCKDLGISGQVTFTGRVNHRDIATYHQQIDIFAALSVLDSESFGVSLVEAMACGKPIVASDVAGFSEVLGQNCGIIVPRRNPQEAAKAILNYLHHPDLATLHGSNARQRVLAHYDWKNNLQQMVSIYKGLL